MLVSECKVHSEESLLKGNAFHSFSQCACSVKRIFAWKSSYPHLGDCVKTQFMNCAPGSLCVCIAHAETGTNHKLYAKFNWELNHFSFGLAIELAPHWGSYSMTTTVPMGVLVVLLKWKYAFRGTNRLECGISIH